ncbi:MAG: type II toxin-antitoxin system RelE/ParE family toxin [Proteobacteria bacterium]|nr:type II toxin-antitoxin system RelE/ParE family toxin [Pseudomonadota bacterium]
MPFAVEFSVESERDFDLIFDHLFESYLGFGESREEAFDHAAHRIMGIRKTADRLATFPARGTARDEVLPGVRHLTIDRAIYWFDVDEAARKVRILAIFVGGQNHVRHMLVRLLREDEATK